jgi:hypothetical protein
VDWVSSYNERSISLRWYSASAMLLEWPPFLLGAYVGRRFGGVQEPSHPCTLSTLGKEPSTPALSHTHNRVSRLHANLLQRSSHPTRVPSTPALAQDVLTQRRIARRPTPPLGSRFDSHATHVRAHQPAELSSVPILLCASSSSSAWVVTSVASFALVPHSHQAGPVIAAVLLTNSTRRERFSQKKHPRNSSTFKQLWSSFMSNAERCRKCAA